MSYLVLARKYRPQTFEEVVQQDHVTRTLMNAIASHRVPHAILFSGPRGTGKTTVARILAKAMNCKQGPTPSPCNVCRSCTEITAGNAVDVFEIDGASNNSVDQIRELRENVKYMPAGSLYKIYIIDEVHMLSMAAFNALLKTLEEPPPHILFMFATTEPHKIPITILSRCQRHDFKRIPLPSIAEHLAHICEKEGVCLSNESLWPIAREADGSIRDALSLLDQVLTWTDAAVTEAQVLDIIGVVDRKRLFDISDALLKGDIPELLDILNEFYRRGLDIKKLYADLVEHFRNLLVVKFDKKVHRLVDVPDHEIDRMRDQVKDVTETFLRQIFDQLFSEETDIRFASQPKLALEMVFVRVAQTKPVLPIDELIGKLEDLKNSILERPRTDPSSTSDIDTEDVEPTETTGPARALPPAENSGSTATSKDPGGPCRDLQHIRQRLLDTISDDYPALAANLTKCVFKPLSEGSLEIEVNGNGFCLNMIRRDKNLSILKDACEHIFGEAVDIRVTANIDENTENQKKKTQTNRLQKEALSHPVVTEAMEIFKGKIIDFKILQEVGE